MVQYSNKILQEIEEEISLCSSDINDSISLWEKIIEIILDKINELKKAVLAKGFSSQEEEILFFKNLKPKIVAKLIYYNAIYKIETKKPYGVKPIRKYLKKELKRLKRFFENNLEFYKYYRNNNSFLDEKFFVRGKHDIKLCLDTYYFQSDQSFSTSHDYKVAKIMANDLIQVYIEDQLYKNMEQEDRLIDLPKLNWTGSKASLIELIYALHYQAVFDNGNADIRLIAKYFESTFNVNLGNFIQTYWS
ncbi:tetracycline resistance element mobilization regulatory protein RteC [Sphingobacterium sp. IITKGP-BTPF85]|nr:tetracycline resistance element mobilization regulatory protein RteC [Sphingobacterium sp. IITKGP-BTPF85]